MLTAIHKQDDRWPCCALILPASFGEGRKSMLAPSDSAARSRPIVRRSTELEAVEFLRRS